MRPIIITHCGSGSDKRVQDAAERAAAIGMKILQRGGSALDAVEESTVILEDDPRLNAGIGSRRRIDGSVQLDAALMDSEMRVGGVAAIMNVRNPIRVARLVMDTPHILFSGEGATLFARRHGIPFFDLATKETEERWRDSLKRLKVGNLPKWAGKWQEYEIKDTVGAVARDKEGRFAASSSSGGTSFMMPGRVGDSPIVGAGLYAGPSGAVTATGVGEEIMRVVMSKYVYDRIDRGEEIEGACIAGVKLFPNIVPAGIIAVNKTSWGEACNRDMAFAIKSSS